MLYHLSQRQTSVLVRTPTPVTDEPYPMHYVMHGGGFRAAGLGSWGCVGSYVDLTGFSLKIFQKTPRCPKSTPRGPRLAPRSGILGILWP